MPRSRRVTVSRSVDLYMGDLARRGRSEATQRSYERLLHDLLDSLPPDMAVAELRLTDFEHFLNRWTRCSPSTLASGVSLCKGFSKFLWKRGLITTDVCEPLQRPKRKRAEDLEVVTVSSEDVSRMISACEDWQELLCLGTAVYLGARRAALARARRRDLLIRKEVDGSVTGAIRFLEKGGKVAVKPIADEYLAILLAADQQGVWRSPDDYLIPNRLPSRVLRAERSDKIVYETVKRVAARAGVHAHVHSLRAAFAVQYDEQNPGEIISLKELMGHNRIETTLVYLRRKDRAKAMETVRTLSWGSTVFPDLVPPTRFELVPPA